MLNLSDIPNIISKSPISKKDKLELLIDFYNYIQKKKPFNFHPQLLDKNKILKK